MTDHAEVPVGRIICFTAGEHSDYGLISTVKVLKPFNGAIMKNLGTQPDDHPYDAGNFCCYRCVAGLIKEGYVDQVDFFEMNIEYYGEYADPAVESEPFKPYKNLDKAYP